MTPSAGHACRTDLERVLCTEMDRQGLPHEHRSLRFRVETDADDAARFEPAIVARRGPILFLVEPVASARGASIRRLTRFLQQHSPELVLVLVTANDAVNAMPPEAYDELYGASEVARLVARIREQDPEGTVVPFSKPPARGAAIHDTAK